MATTLPAPRAFAQKGLLSGIGPYDTGGLEGSPSIWGPGWLGADRSGSGPGGILGYTPTVPADTVTRGGVEVPLEMAMHEGSNKYENYVRAWPDLLNHYLNNIPADTRSMADWGKHHWDVHGQYETDPSMEAFRGRGMWGDTPVPRSSLGPGRFQASRHLPGMQTAYDPRANITDTSAGFSGGLPQPDVEGYKYEYPVYQWGGNEDPNYTYAGHTTADISEYPYYPYMPYGGEAIRSRNDRILVGQRLIPGSGSSSGASTTMSRQADYTPNYATDSSNNGGRQYITNFPSTGNTFEDYVTRYPDLDAAYSDYLNTQDSSTVDFWEEPGIQHGVGGMTSNYPGTAMSKAQFGHAHWLNNGKTEGRIF